MASLAGKRIFRPRQVPPMMRSMRARAALLAGTAALRFDLPPNAKRAQSFPGRTLPLFSP
jgi:hypothetical protein